MLRNQSLITRFSLLFAPISIGFGGGGQRVLVVGGVASGELGDTGAALGTGETLGDATSFRFLAGVATR